jgi:hypothetical protein
MDLRARPLVMLIAAVLALGTTAGCVGDPSDGGGASEEVDAENDAVAAALFVRSDQVSFGRAPANTGDLSDKIANDFSNPDDGAAKVIAWIKDHPGYEKPIYLGDIQTWVYDTSHTYRVNVHTLASKIHAATKHPILFYFEEENASHAPHPVSTANAESLRTLAKSATLLCATYANGQMTHGEEIAAVMHYRHWYHDVLGVPMASMMIDVDTSQTPVSFYYGSRGDLANFDHVIVWTLNSAYAHGFAGFHTFGNVGGKYGTKRAADSTYAALDDAWKSLKKNHPKQAFSGL